MRKVLKMYVLFTYLLFYSHLSANDDTIEKYGDAIQILIPTTAYLTTLYIDDKEGQKQFYKSFFSTFGTTHLLKRTVQEERPNGSNSQSFPSGHTSASFQGASFIHFRYGLKYAVLAYAGALFVGYSRVHSEMHYTHDVVAGAIIGTAFSYYFTTPYKYNSTEIQPIVYNSLNTQTTLYGIKVVW